jgi:predicted RNA polymerase sigma factor
LVYDALMTIAPSAVVALNRAISLAQIRDARPARRVPVYHAARGELALRCRHATTSRRHFETVLALARNHEERRFLEKRVAACI